jgi:AcrR family transcriptional regulator
MKTVYNYFPSKQSILIELLREDRLRAKSAYEAIASDPPSDLAEALARLIHADVGDVATPQSKKLWRELLAAETRSHEKPGDEFEKTRDIFLHYVREILVYFRKKEELSPRVSIPVAMKMVYSILAYNFREYCATESMTPEDLYAATKKQIKLLLIAWVDE